ncbi:hypothetical protein KJ554_02530 [bacterium]|nr:hypothetical protein [bacterium]
MSLKYSSFDGAGLPMGEPALALVLGDFGRDAALRFGAVLAAAERAFIQRHLPADAPFFDEHRRLTLTLVGDLPYVKQEWLASYARQSKPLDEAILVGFPGGPSPEQVQARLGVLALEAMRGPVGRGCRRVLVLLPCNTLAPVAWGLATSFRSPRSIQRLLAAADWHTRENTQAFIQQLSGVALSFPTVPEAVIQRAEREGATHLLPMGTEGIAQTYRQALSRQHSALELVGLPPGGQDQVLRAIQAAIAADGEARDEARRALEELTSRSRVAHGPGLLAIEACTDLDYGVGLDSNAIYAEEIVRLAYGDPADTSQSPSRSRSSSLSLSKVNSP